MRLQRTLILGALLMTALAGGAGTALADFITVENFDHLELGPISGQGEWHAGDPTCEVTADPVDPGNQVLTVITESTYAYRPVLLPAGEERMVFLRFRYEDQLSASCGLSDQRYPSQFGDYDVELNLTSTTDDLRINDDGFYTRLTTLRPGQWYNCWLLVDNGDDHTTVWLHDRDKEAATDDDKLTYEEQSEFFFRGLSPGDLQNFFIKTGGGQGVAGPLRIDDIHLEMTDAVNLANPTGDVAAAGPPAATLRLLGARPNPFNPQTTVAFSLDFAQSIELEVFDARGRRVRRLGAGTWAAGPHTMAWDGRDDAGGSVASGVYFVRLAGERQQQSQKLTLAR